MSVPADDLPNVKNDAGYAVGRPLVPAPVHTVAAAESAFDEFESPDFAAPAQETTHSLGAFYCTVYTFPVRGRASLRWLLLTAGLAPGLAMGGYVIDQTNWLAVGSLALIPMLLCASWSAAYGSALFFCIVEATAAGANTVEEWPGEEWQDWVDRAIQFGYTAGVATVMSVAMINATKLGAASVDPSRDWSFLTPFSPVYWISIAVLVYFLFPVVLMSSMQAEFRWAPLTWQVLRSLVARKTAWLWLLFWLSALPLVALVCGQLAFSVRGWYAVTGAGLGALLAGAWMIYARLLGRLGWEISERLAVETEPSGKPPADEPDTREGERGPQPATPPSHAEGSPVTGEG